MVNTPFSMKQNYYDWNITSRYITKCRNRQCAIALTTYIEFSALYSFQLRVGNQLANANNTVCICGHALNRHSLLAGTPCRRKQSGGNI